MGKVSTFRAKIAAWLRRDGAAILLFVVAVLVMTYPLAFRPAYGLPSRRGDIYAALWQKWWLGEVIRHGYDPNFAHLLRHPTGLDTTFQAHRWAALGTWYPLSLLFGDVAAYNVNFMLGLLVSAYAAYLLILYLTRHRAAAWVGGAFFAFYPAHLLTAMFQPNTGTIQWLPVFMLVLVTELDRIASADASPTHLSRRSAATMLLAALTLSINIYITVKPCPGCWPRCWEASTSCSAHWQTAGGGEPPSGKRSACWQLAACCSPRRSSSPTCAPATAWTTPSS